MKRIIFLLSLLAIIVCFSRCSDNCMCGKGRQYDELRAQAEKIKQFKKKVNHIIIIYQENWSFDGLYGKFPGANNLSCANTYQVDRNGKLLDTVPYPLTQLAYGQPWITDTNFKIVDSAGNRMPLAARPYDLNKYISASKETGDITHLFYIEQLQIDSGRMDKFAAYSQNPGLVQSYFDATTLPEGQLAQQYTLCDNFFHSAFGGSFLNHIWLIAAASPVWKNAPAKFVTVPGDTSLSKYDNVVTPDGYVVNTSFSINTPRPKFSSSLPDSTYFVPYQKYPTIGDRLNDAGISWAWYAGGWNDALAGHPDESFQYHHQPFIYFENYRNGSDNKAKHLKDETDFYTAVKDGKLPQVSFIKCLGVNDEHPKYSNLQQGQQHVDSLVKMVMASKYWDDAVIIIAYDEHGGRWDHVAPPKIDRWGPGSRVPCIIISKYAKKKFVDHTLYETVSILKLIESRFGVSPLTSRDSAANNMMNAFEF